MKKITCDYCFEDHFFNNENDRPQSCKNCNSPMQHINITDDDEKMDAFKFQSYGLSEGIVLTYQKTGDLIEIPHSEIIILGRQNLGKEVFGNIPHISREHCKIEFVNGRYLVSDLNSLNGTFIGSKKRDCLRYKMQELKDNSLLYLGREPFLVNIITPKDEASMVNTDVNDEIGLLRFKCQACGKIHEMNLLICDACGSYGQIEPLEN